MVFQEQSLITNLSIAENIFLGNEAQFIRFGRIDWPAMSTAAARQLSKVGLAIDPLTVTSELSFMHRQMVELAKVAAGMVDAVASGGKPEINDTKTYNNKIKIVPSYLLTPVPVDATNWQKALVDSGYYKADQLK